MQMATSIETDNGEMIVKRVSVPIGLEELMEGLTKEVILKKPKDIYVFASEYFANLLNLREKGSLKVPGRKAHSVTKQFPNDVEKRVNTKTKSVDSVRHLPRQKSVRSDSPTKKSLTTKKIVLNSKEEKDEKKTDKTKTFLDKRKARKNSKDILVGNKKPEKSTIKDGDKNEKKTPRSKERSSSINSSEGSLKTPRKGSDTGKPSSKNNKKSTPRSSELKNNLNKEGTNTAAITESVKELEMHEGNNEKTAGDDVCTGCTMTSEGAVDRVTKSMDKLSSSLPENVELINEEKTTGNDDASALAHAGENVESKNLINSVDEVDSKENLNSEINEENKQESTNLNDTENVEGSINSSSLESEPQIVSNNENTEINNNNDQISTENISLQQSTAINKTESSVLTETTTTTNEGSQAEEKEIAHTEKKGSSQKSHDMVDEIDLEKKDITSSESSENTVKDDNDKQIESNDSKVISDKNTGSDNGTLVNEQEVKSIAESQELEVAQQDEQENKENIDKENVQAANPKEKTKNIKMKSFSAENIKPNETKDKNNKKVKRIKSVDSKTVSSLKTINKKIDKRSLTTEADVTQQKSFDASKLHNELIKTGEIAKATNFKTSFNPYKLRQEIKQASENSSSVETSDMSKVVSEIAAAIKLQSLWRGFSVRKQKHQTRSEQAEQEVNKDTPVAEDLLKKIVSSETETQSSEGKEEPNSIHDETVAAIKAKIQTDAEHSDEANNFNKKEDKENYIAQDIKSLETNSVSEMESPQTETETHTNADKAQNKDINKEPIEEDTQGKPEITERNTDKADVEEVPKEESSKLESEKNISQNDIDEKDNNTKTKDNEIQNVSTEATDEHDVNESSKTNEESSVTSVTPAKQENVNKELPNKSDSNEETGVGIYGNCDDVDHKLEEKELSQHSEREKVIQEDEKSNTQEQVNNESEQHDKSEEEKSETNILTSPKQDVKEENEESHQHLVNEDRTDNNEKAEVKTQTRSEEESNMSVKEGGITEKDSDVTREHTNTNDAPEKVEHESILSKAVASTVETEHVSQNEESGIDKNVPIKSEIGKPEENILSMADAVLKIQALWRGFEVRKQLRNKTFFGPVVEREVKNKEPLEVAKNIDKSGAASKIQALWKGYKVRKNINEVNSKLAELQKPQECDEMPSQRELSDEDIFKAATKIQAGMRGYMVRKKRNAVSNLKSIAEESSPEGKITDEDVLESLQHLRDIPRNSPDLDYIKKDVDTALLESVPLSSKSENSNLQENENSTENNETTGNELSKNNLITDTEKDSKKAENEVDFIASDLNSSTTNKLAGSDTDAIIDDSVSNGTTNNDEVDPISRKNSDELNYEDAPTRPVTSHVVEDTKSDHENGEKIHEKKSEHDNIHNIDKSFTEGQNTSNKTDSSLNEIDGTLLNDKEKQSLPSRESSTSVDSGATVIFNGTKADSIDLAKNELDEKLREDSAETGVQEENTLEKAVNASDETKSDTEQFVSKENHNVENASVENLKEDNETSSAKKVNADDEAESDKKGNEETQNEDTSDSDTNKIQRTKENLAENTEKMLAKDERNEEEEHVPTEENTAKIITSEKNVQNTDNEENRENSLLQEDNVVKNSQKNVDVSSKDNEDKLRTNSPETGETKIINTNNNLNIDNDNETIEPSVTEQINNKMNKSALEKEIKNSNKQLQEMVARNSEELSEKSEDSKKEFVADSSTTDESKTEHSPSISESNQVFVETKLPSARDIKEKNTSKEGTQEETEKGKSLHIQIPLRELCDIREDETETKSSLDSVDELEDENKSTEDKHVEKTEQGAQADSILTTNEQTKNDSPLKEKTLKHEGRQDEEKGVIPSITLEYKEKSEKGAINGVITETEGTTINLVHSGEFHDTITVPIPVTPPTRTSSRQSDHQAKGGKISPEGLVHSGELHDNVLPLSVQLNDPAPAGAEILTSHVSKSLNNDGQDRAQASNKDASTCETQSDNRTSSAASMETEKRNNSTIQKKNMEAEAATKIQAGFRGYQVRKQLKNKISSPGDISNQRRSARRKSSGRITDSGRIIQNKSKSSSDIEEKEKSAVKIQAGVRGFLVRRRQKKQKQGKQSS